MLYEFIFIDYYRDHHPVPANNTHVKDEYDIGMRKRSSHFSILDLVGSTNSFWGNPKRYPFSDQYSGLTKRITNGKICCSFSASTTNHCNDSVDLNIRSYFEFYFKNRHKFIIYIRIFFFSFTMNEMQFQFTLWQT